MLKLLPKNQLAKVKREYHLRIATTALFFAFLAIILATAFLMPSYILSVYRVVEIKTDLVTVRNKIIEDNKSNLGPQVKNAKSQLDALDTFTSDVYWYGLLSRLIGSRSAGISINRIAFTRAGEGEGSISFGGVAKTRGALTTLVKNLERQTVFSKINLPVSNLAKSKDIDFSLNTLVSF